jgi:hypothetical protein
MAARSTAASVSTNTFKRYKIILTAIRNRASLVIVDPRGQIVAVDQRNVVLAEYVSIDMSQV